MKIDPATLMNTTEKSFAFAVTTGKPSTTAARLAGLSIGSADRYLRRPAVAQYLRGVHAHLTRLVAKIDAGPRPVRHRASVTTDD